FFWLRTVTGVCLWMAGLVWLLYVALEPYARRHWPRLLVGWSRLLAGRVRDPMVGRDALLGLAAGALVAATLLGVVGVRGLLTGGRTAPLETVMGALPGARQLLAATVDLIARAVMGAVSCTAALAVGAGVLRRRPLAVAFLLAT